MTDQELFKGIAQQDNKTFLFLYREYQGQILRMVQQNNGNEAEAMDIFQEGIIALWTNISQGKFLLKDSAKLSTYLFAMCRNIWISKLRRQQKTQVIDGQLEANIPEEIYEMEAQHEQIQELEQQFRKLGEACRQLLRLFYYKKASIREIAQEMSLTEKTAKNNKYRCMQNLRALYKTESQT